MITNNLSLPELDRRKEEVAQVYNLASEGYDLPPLKFFSLSASRLIELLRVQPGENILDIGTGTGAASILAAQRCQPGGQVIGIDLAGDMLRVARHKAEAAGLANLELKIGDGENLEFPANTFDLVLATAAIFFLPDMQAGLKEWRRVCKPGGRVAFTGFGSMAFQPISDLFENLIRSYGVTFPVPGRPFSWQRLGEADEYSALLQQAPYQEVEVHTKQLGYYLSGVDEWWQIIWNSGFRGPVSRLSSTQLQQFKAEHLAQVAALQGPRGIWLNLPVTFAWGYKCA